MASRFPTLSAIDPETFGQPDTSRPGLVRAGLTRGVANVAGMLGGAVEGFGRLTGLRPLENTGDYIAARSNDLAATAARPDLDIAPWREGGASTAEWLPYQVASQLPVLGAYMAGARGVRNAGMVPQSLARVGESAPRWMGGGRGLAPAQAQAAGQSFAANAAGSLAVGAPMGFGSMYQEAEESARARGANRASWGDAAAALVASPTYALADALDLNILRGAGTGAGGFIRRVLTGGARAGILEMPQEGVQTAMEMSFRDDLSPQQKMDAVVDAALTGGAVGGILGGASASVRRQQRVGPGDDTATIEEKVDQALERLALPAPSQPGGPQMGSSETIYTDSQGIAASEPGTSFERGFAGRREFDPPQPEPTFGPQDEISQRAVGATDLSGVPDATLARALDNVNQFFTGRSFDSLTPQEQEIASRAGEIQAELQRRYEASIAERDRSGARVAGLLPPPPLRLPAPPDFQVDPQGSVTPRAQMDLMPPASAPVYERKADPKAERSYPTIGAALKGISTRRAYLDLSELPMNTPEQRQAGKDAVRERLIERLEEGSAADGDFKLAERLGVDVQAATAPRPIESEGPAIQNLEVDPIFQDSWRQELVGRTGRMATTLERNLAPNIEVARRQIYDLMGSGDFRDPNSDTQFAQLETLAVRLGLQDQQGNLTDVGMAVARQALPDAVVAEGAADANIAEDLLPAFTAGARGTKRNARGFKGKQALAFKRGQQWATDRRSKAAPIPQTLPANETQAVMERVGRGDIPQRVRDVQAVNNLIDAQFSGLGDAVNAQLRRLARGGATETEINRAAAFLQANPDATLPGLTVERAAPRRAETAGRGQPRFVEEGRAGLERAERRRKNEIENLRHTLRSLRDTDNITAGEFIRLSQALRRGDIEMVRRNLPRDATRPMYQGPIQAAGTLISMNNPIQSRVDYLNVMRQQAQLLQSANEAAARYEGATDPAQQERAWQELVAAREALAAHRDRWDAPLDEWDDVVSGRITEQEARGGRPVGQRAPADIFNFEQAYRDSSMDEAVDQLIKRSKGPQRVVAQRIKSTLGRLKAAGYTFEFNLAQAGDQVPQEMNWARGLSSINGKKIQVWIAGSTMTNPGVEDAVVMHEMVHAVTQATIDAGVSNTPHGRAVRELNEVTSFLQAHLRNREQAVGREGLTDFERQIVDNQNNALDDAHEVIAWTMADADMQAYLQSIEYAPRQTLWQRIVNAIKSILGMPAGASTTALEAVMRASEGIMNIGANAAGRLARGNPTMVSAMMGGATNEGFNEQLKAGAGAVQQAADRIRAMDLNGKLREMKLGWNSRHSIVQEFSRLFQRENAPNGLEQFDTAHNERATMVARLSQLAVEATDAFQALRRENRESAALTEKVMSATEFGFDPTKAWKDQHPSVLNHENAENLKTLHSSYFNMWRKLQARGHTGVYTQMRVVNELQSLSTSAVTLHMHISYTSAKALPEFASAPMDDFMAAQAQGQMNPQQARDWWDTRLSRQEAALNQWLSTQRSSLESLKANPNVGGLRNEVAEISKRIGQIRENRTAMEASPYFHLGRYGNHFVSWEVEEGKLGDIGDALTAAGFDGVFSRGNESPKVYMRLDSLTAQTNLVKKLAELEKRGLVKAGTVKFDTRSKETFRGMSAFTPDWVQRIVERLNRSSSLSEDERQMVVDDLMSFSLDLLPDNASAKMLTKRQDVPGYSPEMARSFDFRSQVWVNSLAGLASSPKINDALRNMNAAKEDIRKNESAQQVSPAQREAMTQVVDELTRRERERHDWPDTPNLDRFNAFTTAWFLGFSPSYGLVNLSSLGTMVMPELGSRHGFSNAFGAIRRAIPQAFKIMREVAKHGYNISLTRAQDAVVTFDVLERAAGRQNAEYLMSVANKGIIDIGGMTRELARAAEGRANSKFDNALRYAGAIGYYTETFARLVTALAVKDLNPKMERSELVNRAAFTITESMFNYSITNQGRQFTKSSVAGPMAPLFTKFLQYQAQYTEKLYREVYDAVKGPTEASRTEARRFLRQHLASMAVIAGSLGLPAVTALAAVIDNLGEWWDDDDVPNNVRASYRAYLADIFGDDLARVATNGIGTAAGFDISRRVGMQDLVPFSRWMDDRRAGTEAFSEMTSRAVGAPFALLESLFNAGQKFLNGDVMGAANDAMPTALRGPWRAVRMAEDGYVDQAGRLHPTQPGVRGIMWQLLGFQPVEVAHQQQQNSDYQRHMTVLRADKRVITNQLIRALESGDDDAARELIARAQQFDRSNPSDAILPTLNETIRRRRRSEARAQASGLPINADPNDPNIRALLDY